jgi:hypothetical protein
MGKCLEGRHRSTSLTVYRISPVDSDREQATVQHSLPSRRLKIQVNLGHAACFAVLTALGAPNRYCFHTPPHLPPPSIQHGLFYELVAPVRASGIQVGRRRYFIMRS